MVERLTIFHSLVRRPPMLGISSIVATMLIEYNVERFYFRHWHSWYSSITAAWPLRTIARAKMKACCYLLHPRFYATRADGYFDAPPFPCDGEYSLTKSRDASKFRTNATPCWDESAIKYAPTSIFTAAATLRPTPAVRDAAGPGATRCCRKHVAALSIEKVLRLVIYTLRII